MSEAAVPLGRRGLSTALDSAWLRRLTMAAVCVLLVAFPLVARSEYRLFVATQIGIYLLVVAGLNVLTGYAGQPSLGHGALLAIGAYTAAIAMVDHRWSFWPSALLGMALTAGVGALMALPAFRVSTWYFALITLGFAEVVGGMLIEWRGLTHSFNGIVGIPKPSIAGHAMGSAELFWLVAALNVGGFAIVANLVQSRFGRALTAVRDNDAAATASGVSLIRAKLFAFVLSAAITGLAGALYAVQKTVITPDDFTAEFSIFFLVVVVLGGAGSLVGARARHPRVLLRPRAPRQPPHLASPDLRRDPAHAHVVRAARAGRRDRRDRPPVPRAPGPRAAAPPVGARGRGGPRAPGRPRGRRPERGRAQGRQALRRSGRPRRRRRRRRRGQRPRASWARTAPGRRRCST